MFNRCRFPFKVLLTISTLLLLSWLTSLKYRIHHINHFRDIQTQTGARVVEPLPCLRLNQFLRNVEPTVNFLEVCDRDWNISDVICKHFCFQNGLPPKQNCLLPDHRTAVPRFVYYVIFSPSPGQPPEFLFMHYLSILSVKKFISPWAIYVISDSNPSGYWWTRVLSDVRGVRYVFRPFPVLTSEKLTFIEHASDIVRLQTLIANGGIYVDTDIILLNPIDSLLNVSLSMGYIDDATGMGNAFIVAERNSAFLKKWYLGYRHYNKTHSFENSLYTAKRLWLKNVSAVNNVADMIYRPNWSESRKLFKETGFNWKSQYAVHIWHRHAHVPDNPKEINKLNTTLGEIFRFVYYGSDKLVL